MLRNSLLIGNGTSIRYFLAMRIIPIQGLGALAHILSGRLGRLGCGSTNPSRNTKRRRSMAEKEYGGLALDEKGNLIEAEPKPEPKIKYIHCTKFINM